MTEPVLTPVFTSVVRADDIPPDTARVVEVAGRSILIVHTDGAFFAVANRCSHADEPLACGRIKRRWIACPAHGARFDVETGAPLGPPADAPIATFAVRIVDGAIEVAA